MMITELQKKAAQAIVNIFETSKPLGNYADVTLIRGDSGHLTYGRSQVTLASGNLFQLILQYCQTSGAQYTDAFRLYLPRLSARDIRLDDDTALRNLLRAAGNDPVMHSVQDDYFDRNFWCPALGIAGKAGITLPLGSAVVYDSVVHGNWTGIQKAANNLGDLAAIGEKKWVTNYLQTRRSWLANHTRKDLNATVYRQDAFLRLIQEDNWNLDLPMSVRGIKITQELFSADSEAVKPELKIVQLADNSVIACHAKVESGVTRVDMRPVCEALCLPLPTASELVDLNPQILPPGITRVDLRPLVEEHGWTLLTHRMAEDNKIYVRKNA